MLRLNNLSLRTKTLAIPAIVLMLSLLSSSIIYFGINESQEREATVKQSNAVLQAIAELQLQQLNAQTGLRGFSLSGKEEFLQPYNTGREQYDKLLLTMTDLVKDNPTQLAKLSKIDQAFQEWLTDIAEPQLALGHQISAGQASFDEMVAMVASGSGKQHFDRIREHVQDFRLVEEALLSQRAEESRSAAAALKTTLIVGTLVLMVVGIVISFMIAGGIARRTALVTTAAVGIAEGRLDHEYNLPSGQDEIGTMAQAFRNMATILQRQLQEQRSANEQLRAAGETKVAKEYLEEVVRSYSQFAHEVTKGNLTARLMVDERQSELSLLGRNLNTMVASLHAMTQQVQVASAQIAAASTEILAATTQQAAGAAEQSSAITQTTTTIEEVKAIARQTAQQATQVASDSQTALDISRQAIHAVEQTVQGMGSIRERVESIAETILALAGQTQAIGVIIQTVNELADQSNLLALNAAIEAARAGEQGKSFAVVAQHVRDLAERSKSATGQVREILGEIQQATNAAVMVTEEGTKGVEVGARLAGQAGQVIHRIACEVENGAQANVQMAAAAQQQTAGMDQIGQAMISIQQATTQTLASTRQAERAAQDLNTLAQSLQRTIATYQL